MPKREKKNIPVGLTDVQYPIGHSLVEVVDLICFTRRKVELVIPSDENAVPREYE